MKSIFFAVILTLLFATNIFAAEGDADRLAGSVMGFVGIMGGFFVLFVIINAVIEFTEWCRNLWNNSTTVGKLIIFGIPLSAVSTVLFYGLFYYAVPFLDMLLHTPGGPYILVLLFECVFIFIGWKATAQKRDGLIATISRCVVLLPILPVIYTVYFLFQLFKLACIKNANVSFNPYIVRKYNSRNA